MKNILLVALAIESVLNLGFAQQPCKPTVVGDLRIEHFESKMYGKTMTVRIWLPPGYADAANASRKYPTLYLLDGQNAFDECTAFEGEHQLRVDEAVTQLIDEHKIAAMIVVGIDSTHDRDEAESWLAQQEEIASPRWYPPRRKIAQNTPNPILIKEREYCETRMRLDYEDHGTEARWLRFSQWCRKTIGYVPEPEAWIRMGKAIGHNV